MAGSKLLQIRVPSELYADLKRMVYTEMYQNSPELKFVYKEILENPTMPLNKLAWRIDKKHGIRRTVEGIRKIAKECGLPYTE